MAIFSHDYYHYYYYIMLYIILHTKLLCSILFMAALCNRGAIIFLPCDFFLSSIFFYLSFFIPRLISAATDWMSTILIHMAWP